MSKDGLGTVAMMHIPIDQQNPPKAQRLGIPGGGSHWIEQTIAMTPVDGRDVPPN
jgi:hypothetical protein